MRLILAFAAVLLLFSAQAQAAVSQKAVAEAEAALQSISTLKARFIQTSAGAQAAGTFWLKRPGKLRFEYDAPIEDFIVADGLFIYFYDSQMKQQSNAPISSSLADFFLRKELRLSGDVTVRSTSERGGLLQVTLAQSKDPGAGTLTLGLARQKDGGLMLKKWRVVDAQNNITEVELFDIRTGVKLKNDLFHYYDPQRRKPDYN